MSIDRIEEHNYNWWTLEQQFIKGLCVIIIRRNVHYQFSVFFISWCDIIILFRKWSLSQNSEEKKTLEHYMYRFVESCGQYGSELFNWRFNIAFFLNVIIKSK